MRKLFLSALLFSTSACLTAQNTTQSIVLDDTISAPTALPKTPISMDLAGIDKTVDPCTDFYAYACGNWRKNNPIPADKVRWGQFDALNERNNYLLYQDLRAAADHPTSPLQTKYGNYFAACMDTAQHDKLGAQPIQPALAKIYHWNNKATLAALLGNLEDKDGVSPLFGFGSEQDQKDSTKQIAVVMQGGLSLPDRDYYLQQDDRMKKIRAQYVEHVTKMFVLLGDTPEKAAAEAKSVMAVETALAEGSTPRVELRDPANVYHIESRAQLQSLTPDFKWSEYFGALRRDQISSLNVATPNFFKTMNQQIASASIGDLKSYLRWHVVHEFAGALSKPFDQENFNFFSATLAGQKEQAPRWKRCSSGTDHALGEAVGQDWVAKNFPPAAKDNMEQLVHALEVALDQDIKGLDWMSDTTKVEAKKKLDAFRDKIGYPEKWRDYSKLDVKRDDYVHNLQQTSIFNDRRDLDKIGQPVDEKEWGMTPPTVNAYYDPSNNDINFPAGILQPPFYDLKIDPAVNFGGIGVVIGHEMTHGFDDEGSQFDPKGNVRMWWTPEDKAKFDERTACEVKEYGAFEPVPGAVLNGKLTLGENTADNGGLHIAYAALMDTLAKQNASATATVDGYTPAQRFFVGFAQVWCENTREETSRMRAKTDPHSPGRFRVNGSVVNFDKFGEAFNCKKGQPMMPVDSCRVW
jgi:putative endopeptidase